MPWMSKASKLQTAAMGGYGTITPIAVVCHVMEGWKNTMDDWARERPVVNQASYHFVIGLDGKITQYVPVDKAAWHTGRVDNTAHPSVAVPWKAYRGTNPNGYTLGIAAEGFSDTSWNEAQHQSCVEILSWLVEEQGMDINEETLIGHQDICPMTRLHDPGPNWDKEWLVAQITEERVPIKMTQSDVGLWVKAWINGATPIAFDKEEEIHQVRIPRRV